MISVIIACYNGAETLAEQLAALSQQRWSGAWELLLVDNRSTDRSVALARSFQRQLPELRIIEANARQGQPYALNCGIAAARGEALLFCDADDVVADGWLAAMASAVATAPLVAGPFDLTRLNPDAVAQGRDNPQPQGVQSYRYPPYLPHAGSGNLAVQRHLFDTIGGFDESLPYLFDTDFCWRAQLAGFPITVAPHAQLHMRLRPTLRGTLRQARRYGEYNVLLYRRYRDRGMPPLTVSTSLRGWWQLLRRWRWLIDRQQRWRWLRQLAWRWGRVVGSLRYRVWAL